MGMVLGLATGWFIGQTILNPTGDMIFGCGLLLLTCVLHLWLDVNA